MLALRRPLNGVVVNREDLDGVRLNFNGSAAEQESQHVVLG